MGKGKCFSMCNQGQRKQSDFYQTPWSLLFQYLSNGVYSPDFDQNESCGDPCAGHQSLIPILKNYFKNVWFYDSNFRPYLFNFFNETQKVENIITNPPYDKANEFIIKAFEIVKNKFAFFLPLSYMHGEFRYQNIYKKNRLQFVYVFTRYPMLSAEVRNDGKYKTGMQVYAWYLFNQNFYGEPQIRWISNQHYVLNKYDK